MIVAHGGTPDQALHAAQAARPKEKATVEFIPPSSPLVLPPVMEQVCSLLPADQPLYLVGGAVRDMLLGRPVRDYDLALPNGAIPFARKLSNQLDADFYILDGERDVARVLLKDGEPRTTLDFSALRGGDLESDLMARDFTINAIAIDLHQPESLLDPLGGASDLSAKSLRACSRHALEDDPIRVLRAIRMAATFGFKIESDTRAWMRAAAPHLATASAERTRDELVRLLLTPQPATSLRALDMLGALEPVLPEIRALKGLKQHLPHTYDVWGHSLHTVEAIDRVLNVLSEGFVADQDAGDLVTGLLSVRLGRYRPQISALLKREPVPGRPLRALLTFAALYHDIAKPHTCVEENGVNNFPGHEAKSAEVAKQRTEALRFSNEEITRLKSAIAHHALPGRLAKEEGGPDRRSTYRFFRDAAGMGVEVCLLSIADLLAIYGPGLPQGNLEKRLDVVRQLLEAYFERHDEIVDPPALLNGDELMAELDLAPGPQVGEILEALREAQAASEVANREQALDLARSLKK